MNLKIYRLGRLRSTDLQPALRAGADGIAVVGKDTPAEADFRVRIFNRMAAKLVSREMARAAPPLMFTIRNSGGGEELRLSTRSGLSVIS